MLSPEELRDERRLRDEAAKYALEFLKQDDAMEYPMGCPDGRMNKAFFYAIEAARLMCGGIDAKPAARKVLDLAIEEIQRHDDE